MHALSIIAASGALCAAAAAQPHAHRHQHQHHERDLAERDLVWVTQWEEEVVTVAVTETVWVTPGQDVPAETQPAPAVVHSAAASASEAAPAPAVTHTVVPIPAPSSSTSQIVAQAPPPSSPAAAATTSAPAPAPTTSAPAAVPTTSSTEAAPTTNAQPAPASTSAASSPAYQQANSQAPAGVFVDSDVGTMAGLTYGLAAGGTEYTGDFTNFTPGLGACGFTNTSSQAIVAISHVIFDSYTSTHDGSNGNPVCGRTLTIFGWNGTNIEAQVVDRCPVCDEGALDMTISLFNYATNTGDGRVHNMKWKWN